MFYKITKRLKDKIKILLMRFDKLVYQIPTIHKHEENLLITNLLNVGLIGAIDFDYNKIKLETIQYIKSLKINDDVYSYKFSKSQNEGNVYSSVYAILLFDLYDEVKCLSAIEKKEWIAYFDSLQNENDGLWYDNNLINEHYEDSDWWGARHLAIHMLAAYTALGARPKYQIKYITKFYDLDYMKNWLDRNDWQGFFEHENDVDNQIMNIGVALQYQRDYFDDKKAQKALDYLFNYLDGKKNKKTGMWGACDINEPKQLSRSVQFAYHLLMLYFYDDRHVDDGEKIGKYALQTQNVFGGFGVELNSSACEDIDSIELVLHLLDNENVNVKRALNRAFAWILSNQMPDGGFVFRQNRYMWYGHEDLSAGVNESHMFATWFRTLCIAKLSTRLISNNKYRTHKAPAF